MLISETRRNSIIQDEKSCNSYVSISREEVENTRKFVFLLGITIFLWLCPLSDIHDGLLCYYIGGVGLGFLIHHFIKRGLRNRAKRYRLGQTILRMLEVTDEKFRPMEIEAITFFSKQDWKKLKKLFKKNPEVFSTILVIVKASMLRVQGKYHEGLEIINKELENPDRTKELDAYLYCQKALALGEIGEEEQMFETLKKSLEKKSDCLLSKVTLSLRLAEKVDTNAESEHRKAALREIWQALQLNARETSPILIGQVIGSTVPVTWTLFLDAYAYALLKVGHYRFSRSLLKQCIKDDPSFSSPYLHLGEWYMEAKHFDKSDKLARLCLLVAKYLEDNKNSLITRRCGQLLNKL